jgi:hypothetical protein
MNITHVTPKTNNSLETVSTKGLEDVSKNIKKENSLNDVQLPYTKWQKDIMLSAINKLENNMQMDDIHPLSRADSAPIDTYQEALIELSYTKSSTFKKQASAAQANLKPEDVLSLFLSD